MSLLCSLGTSPRILLPWPGTLPAQNKQAPQRSGVLALMFGIRYASTLHEGGDQATRCMRGSRHAPLHARHASDAPALRMFKLPSLGQRAPCNLAARRQRDSRPAQPWPVRCWGRLHYDALAVAAFEGAPEDIDVSVFVADSEDGRAYRAAATQLACGPASLQQQRQWPGRSLHYRGSAGCWCPWLCYVRP
jgi:hypothetical protein